MKTEIVVALEKVINTHSVENDSNTPDFILAGFLADCCEAFARATRMREEWYGVKLEPAQERREVSMKEFAELQDDSIKLRALEAAGVDNWEGYDVAMEGV